MIRKVDHVGIAVRKVEEGLRFWEDALGLRVAGRERVASEGVEVAFLPIGSSRIELLEAIHPDSAVGRFLENRGPGFHHLTLEVDDLQGLLDRLREREVTVLDDTPRAGAGGTSVAFVHPRSTGGVLLELVQKRQESAGRIGIVPGETVLAYLREPQEKLWGVLRQLDPTGLVVEGIDLGSFDDWIAQLERREESAVGPSVLFLPMLRVEKILLDRPSGSLPSLSDRFYSRTGRTVQEVLGA